MTLKLHKGFKAIFVKKNFTTHSFKNNYKIMETKSYTYFSHKLGKEVSVDLNNSHLVALIERHVKEMVKQMETEDLIQYVTDDMYQHLESVTAEEVIDECVNYWDDMFDDVVEEVKANK